MAGFVDKFKRMWDAPDDEYEYNDYDDYEGKSDRDRDRRADSDPEPRIRRSSARYDDIDDVEPSTRDTTRRNKVVNISATAKLSVALFKPERFGEETRNIADELIKTHTVVLNLENTNKDVSRRILDFVSGVAYAQDGKIKKVAVSTFIVTPYNVDILGDLIDELENNGLYL